MTSHEIFLKLDSPSGVSSGDARQKPDRHFETQSPNATRPISADARLIARLIRRDSNAWQEFVSKYERLIVSRVHATCHEVNITAHSDLVEDCAGEFMTSLFHNDLAALRKFEGRSKLSTWLSVVIRRCALRVIKRRRQHSDRTCQTDSRFDIMIPETEGSRLDTDGGNRQELLQTCLQLLSERDREVIRLYFEHQLSYADIGSALGITENAVGPRLHRARKRLGMLMESHRDE